MFKSLKLKMTVSIGAFALAILMVFAYFAYSQVNESILVEEKNYYELVNQTIKSDMENQIHLAELGLVPIAKDKEIIEAFANGDREELINRLKPVYDEMEEMGIFSLMFNRPPARAFLRLQDLSLYDDDLSDIRATVVEANSKKAKVVGLEEGRLGYAFRVLLPIEYEGKFVGSIESGMDLSREFLDRLKQDVSGEYFVYNFSDSEGEALSGTLDQDKYLVGASILEEAKSTGQMQYVYSQDESESILIIPFEDFSGETKGYIKAVLSRADTLGRLVSFSRKIKIFVSVGILIVLLVVYLLAGSFSNPIKDATIFAAEMAGGDFTKSISDKYLSRTDEIGELSRAFGSLGENFRKMIRQIYVSAEELSSSSIQTASVSQNAAANMEEISASTEELSAGLEEVAASSEEISASSQEMNSLVEHLVESMVDGNEVALEIDKKAVQIEEEVIRSREAALGISQDLNQRLQVSIDKAQVVDSIANMAEQISDIAEQTNLLALNAAIEAARAGDQGRGFAVVAEEVRKLAMVTGQTVERIQEETIQVQESIKILIDDTEELLEFISRDVDMDYEKFLDTAEEYKKDSHTFNELTNAAASMGRDVLTAVNEVAHSINEVTITIQESAEGVNEIAEGTEETANSVAEINEASGKLSNMSEELIELIAKFKI